MIYNKGGENSSVNVLLEVSSLQEEIVLRENSTEGIHVILFILTAVEHGELQ